MRAEMGIWRLRLVAVGAFVAVAATAATWTGAQDAFWTNAANWAEGAVPGKYYAPDGTLAGAASDLFEDMCNAIRFGIPYQEAILAATMNPARVIGAEEEIGSIAPGKRADLVVCDSSLRRKEVYIRGRRVRA